MVDMFEIRPATFADGPDVADTHIASWRAAYRGLVADRFLDGDEFAAPRRRLWHDEEWRTAWPGSELLVATAGGAVVGFSLLGGERLAAGEPPTGRGEVMIFYLRPEAWGTGVAAALMAASEAELVQRGFERAVLWVLRDNARARRFYTKAGWTASDAEKHVRIDDVDVAEVRYDRRLTD